MRPGSSLRAIDHAQGPILFVRVPNPEFCHIGERYGDLISEALENLGLEFRDVEFVTAPEQRPEPKRKRQPRRCNLDNPRQS